VRRAWPVGSVIRVLTVVEVPPPLAPEFAVAANFAETQEELRKEGEATVRSFREIVERTGLRVETHVRQGRAGREIVEEAKEWGADLVLMGSHGRTGLKRVLMGGVAQHVVSHAPCSVEVVRGTEAEAEAPSPRDHSSA
jgi:nucleotide-binding universal stress UspA family protein